MLMVRYNHLSCKELVPFCMSMGQVAERVSDTVLELVAVQALRCMGIGLVAERVSDIVLELLAVQVPVVQMFRCRAQLAAVVLHDLYSVPDNNLSGSVVYMRALVLSGQGADSSDFACQVPASTGYSAVLASRHDRNH
jgi:hypothetical protein